MLISDITLNNGNNDAAIIEKKFDRVRIKYLKDLNKLRRKYARRFLKLSNDYNAATLITQH